MSTRTINIIVKGKDEASGPLDRVGAALGGIGQIAGGILAADLVRRLAGGFADLAGSILPNVNGAADLESQLSSIQAVMGATSSEVERLESLIEDLGIDPKLKVTATEAADAIEMLGRNGLKVEEILGGAAKATVLLANATGGTFPMAADIATDVMANWKIPAGEMMTAVNGVTSVVNNSKFSVEDYALALAQGGGVAAGVGVDFMDFNASIAGTAALFASGSDAGTAFKTFLQRLVPVSGPAAEAMMRLGILTENGANQFFHASGEMKSMAEIAGVLEGALDGLSEEDRTALLNKAFGTDAIRTAIGLAEVGEEGFRSLLETMGQTDAADAAATRMDNLRGAMEILGGVFETLQLKAGEPFLPLIRQGVEWLATKAAENMDSIVGFFEGIAGGIGGMLSLLENFNFLIRNGIEPLDAFKIMLGALIPPALVDLLGPLIDGVFGFGDALGEAGRALFAYNFMVANGVEPSVALRAVLESLMPRETVDLLFQGAEGIGKFVAGIVAFVQALPPETIESVAGFAVAIGMFQVATTVVAGLSALVAGVTALGAAISAAMPVVLGVGAAILSGPLVAVILIGAAVGALAVAWEQNWGGIQQTTASAWFGVAPYLDQIRVYFAETIPQNLADMRTAWDMDWRAVQATTSSVTSAVTGILDGIGRYLTVTIPGNLSSMKNAWERDWQAVGQVTSSITGGIRGGIDGVKSALDGLTSRISGFLSWLRSLSVPNPFAAIAAAVGGGGGGAGQNALGTPFWRGGLSLVGEDGPEMVYLPRGSQVVPAPQTREMLRGGGGDTFINISLPDAQIGSDMDEEALFWRLARRLVEAQG